MVMEIELKAHVGNYQALKVLLSQKAKYLGAFEKEDTYWFQGKASTLPPSGLRVRREKRGLPDGTEKSSTIVTYKNRERRDGIEVNDEHEFEVKPGPEFEGFLKLMGLKPEISKRKQGWAYSWEGICAELVKVDGLGWFVELEIIADGIHADGIYSADRQEEVIMQSKDRLLDFLAGLGIAKEAIESRYYTAMLQELVE